jgi:hypothetical protein
MLLQKAQVLAQVVGMFLVKWVWVDVVEGV